MPQATIIPGLSQNPPARSDPSTFDPRGASLLADLPNLVDKINTVVSELNTWNADTEVDKTSTGASRTASIASEQAAKTSALASAQRSAVWASGVNYSVGYLVESPITARQYRCILSGVSTTDPSLDSTRWEVLGFEFNTQYPNIKPTLNLNFAKTKILGPRITFTRNSIGTYFDQYGVLRTAQNNQARFDHDPVTGESLGLLIEEQRTNLVLRSEEFDNASWTKLNTTLGANAVASPDGSLTAEKLIATTTAAQHYIGQAAGLLSAGTYTFSFYIKAGELARGECTVGSAVGGANGFYASFNLSTATATLIGQFGTGFTGHSASLSAVGNGWFRFSITGATSVTGNISVQLNLYNAAGSISFAGNGYDGIYIWGAQLEAGSFPTSYIPTTTAQVTRAADAAVMTGTNFSSWYRQDEGTLYEEGSAFKSNTDANPRFTSSITDGLANFVMGLRYTTAVQPRVDSGGSVQVQLTTLNPHETNVFCKSAIAVRQNDFAASANGLTPLTDTSGVLPTTMNTLSIGSYGTAYLCGHIKKIAYYPKRLSNTELQALTRP